MIGKTWQKSLTAIPRILAALVVLGATFVGGTCPAVAQITGPGGPVLVVTAASNPFTTYYAEILRAEGLNLFGVAAIGSVTPATLDLHDVAILGEMPLTAEQVTMLSDWVTNRGGRLIAMKPDKQLAGLLGLTDAGATLTDQYLLINTSQAPGAGLVGETIQFHGVADRYALNGATSLATLYSNATTATTAPAVTLRTVGTGQAAAFTYDLAKSVVFTRQGNPSWAGQERDGTTPATPPGTPVVIRPNDLFYGASASDPQPDWVNLNKVAIPQADEQQRLLANLVLTMNQSRKPLPRFWYFPRKLPGAVVMTGDEHETGITAARFDAFVEASPPGCNVDNWECIRGTAYVYPVTPLSDAQAAAYTAQGFEVALHVSTNCANWNPESLEGFFASQLSQWSGKFPSLTPPATLRTHCVAWSDYATQPQVSLSHGIRLDTNYYYWPLDWVNNRPGLFTGSGMPMRFATAQGAMINVYQAATQMTDESGQTYPFTIDALLNKAIGVEGFYGAFTANMHNEVRNPESSVNAALIVASAKARGIPVVTARQMLQWLDARNSSSFGSVTWNGTVLSFSVTAGSGANGLQAMVPVPQGKQATVTAGGSPVANTLARVKGVAYAFFPAASGSYQVTFADDTTAPTVVSVSPTPGATGMATGATVSAIFSEAVDSATVNTTTFELRDAANSLVPATVSYALLSQTATVVPATPFNLASTYTATVKGGAIGVKDLAGNALAADVTWAFTTAQEFGAGLPPDTTVFSAILPVSRSAVVGSPVTVFGTIINAGGSPATGCGVALSASAPPGLSLLYQTTDPATNQVTGTANTPVNLAAGAPQSFVLALTPSAPFSPMDLPVVFDCANSSPADVFLGVNTLLISGSTTPVPDVVALAATLTNDGIVNIPGTNGTGVFAVASVNLGTEGVITVAADTGSASLPVNLFLCQTNPGTGQCLQPPAGSVTTTIPTGATPTFGIFVQGTGSTVAFSPAVNRVFVRFREAGGAVRGATGVAVRTQ